MTTKRKRAKKRDPNARCCWICGRIGGAGFTTALRLAGYDVPKGEIGYAHPPCMQRVRKNRVTNRRPRRYEVIVTLPPMKFHL